MAVKIVTDTTSNITIEEAKELNISLLGIGITFSEFNFIDQYELSTKDFYDKLLNVNDFPKTNQLSLKEIIDVYEDAKDNDEEVLTLFLSSKLSGTHSTAYAAGIDYDNIYNVDTLQTAGALRILVLEACKLRDLGYSAKDIKQSLDILKTKIRTYAILDTLEYLYKGGRLSRASMVIGEALKLKPAIFINEGKVEVLAKARGNKNIVKKVVDIILQDEIDHNYPVYYLYTTGDKNAQTFMRETSFISEESDLLNLNITGAVGAHVGPNATGLIYVYK